MFSQGMSWALSWSLRGSWRALCAAPPSTGVDLQALDGLRVLGLLCFVIEHVCWLNTLTYIVNTRHVEKMRSETDVMLVSNSTLMVQAFFLMSAFLLANKLLQQRRRQQRLAVCSTILDTMLNRIVRMSPTYFMVVWFASSWWVRGGAGPLWAPLVAGEAAVCRRKWWTHLLYLNNLLLADDKCLIQTWYLAADMQLYLCALLLTLALWRLRRAALLVLGALLVAVVLAAGAAAYAWHLVPTFVLHRPEAVRALYSGDLSFNLLYQSPLGNAPGALVGLLLAHLHHALLDANVRLSDYRWFRWAAWWAPWLALWWVALSPKLLGAGPPARAAAAALAAGERAVFAIFVATALLGAMHGVKSPVRTVLSWRGWAVLARLSFGALLLHMIINKSLLAAQLAPTHLDRTTAILQWFGVAAASYMAALPLALLVEIPVQRLYKELRAPRTPPEPERVPKPEKTRVAS
ncbi:O-acyltransferase like protein-like [Ostrinia furnacalis]|uniref:O-acyltransferase like protein-like n=1 Tax=Ostrinia furnacalis TaxID=93504 RepID=UPI00103F391F|nr:O-acyltransferase like protein-like [Ostrinia furnacalis]